MKLVAVTGGIGAGKSVVCRILEAMGYPVYDCDSQAKTIMDKDPAIHARLTAEIHPRCVVDGCIDRVLLADVVFNDKAALGRLNAIVHGAVKRHLSQWCAERRAEGCRLVFVETAILRQSGLDRIVDDIWEVTAPLEVRIERVAQRNGLSRDKILARIESQSSERIKDLQHRELINAPDRALLPQIHALIS